MKTQAKHLLWLLALSTAIVAPASAQTAPGQKQTTQPPPDDDIVRLSTFVVSTDKDTGYIAADSLAGGRQSMPIRLTPSAMSSMTAAFIQDVGIRDVRDALRWSLNVIPGDINAGKGSPFNSWDYNFRGSGQNIQGGAGPTRNYFTFYQVADAYNLERIEFDRGPNSILFGIGTIGGTLNVYTKNARLDKNFITPAVQIDNFGSARLTVDGNWAVSKKFALRLNMVGDNQRGWRENDVNKKVAADLAALWQISDKTQFRFDIEGGKASNTVLQTGLAEGYSQWDGTTVANTASTVIPNADAAGVGKGSPWGQSDYWLYIPSLSGKGVQNFVNSYHTNGNYMPLAPYSGFYNGTLYSGTTPYKGGTPGNMQSRDYTVGSGMSRPEYYVITANLDHTFTKNFDMGVAFYRYGDLQTATNYEGVGNWAVDVNRQLPDGSANPNFGKYFGDYFMSKQVQKHGVNEGRVQANYKFDAGPVKQRFSVAGGLQEITWNGDQYQAIYTNNPGTSGQPYSDVWRQNMVWARLYADQPNYSYNTPSSIGGRNIAYVAPATDWFNFDEVQKISNVAFVSHTRLWDDLVSILAGVRYDDYEYNQNQHYSKKHTGMKASDTTYSIGGIAYLPWVRWLGVFANYSTNFNPLSPGAAPQLNGQPLPGNTGDGGDVGLRISTKDGKYYASASYYYGTSKNRASNTILGFSGYWQNYYTIYPTADNAATRSARTSLSYSDVESLDLKGWEFEVTANPLSNLRIQASFALPEAKYSGAGNPGQNAYWAQYAPIWQQAVIANINSPISEIKDAASQLNGKLTNGAVMLQSSQAGLPQANTVDYTFNIFANYTFDRGFLKNFSVGAGEVVQGRKYITTIRNQEWYADKQYYTNLVLAYDTKGFGHHPVRIALNIDNLLNKRNAVTTSFDGGWAYSNGTPAANGYYQPTPITFRLSAQITF